MELKNILRRIEKRTGAVVDIEFMNACLNEIKGFELDPDQRIHHGPFCDFVKLTGRFADCELNKEKSKRKAAKGKSFCGTCIHGVWDMACPVIYDDLLLAIIYLGHFKTSSPLCAINGRNYTGPALQEISQEKISELNYYAEFIKEYITLEFSEWLDAGNMLSKYKNVNFYKKACLDYIERHFSENVNLNSFADHLKLKANYVSGIVKNEFGRGFNRLINEKRIEHAKVQLFETKYSISEVAFMCGFKDSNYFSTVFKKYTGISPVKHRKMMRKESTGTKK